MTITIKAAQLSDLNDLEQMMFDLHHEHHVQSPQLFKTAQEIEQEKSIARYLDDPECLVYIAVAGGHNIAFVSGHFCELISSVSKAVPMGSVDELYVKPDYRQQGVASALLQKIESTFFDYGVQQMFVEVWDFNQSGQHLYQSVGFEPHIHWLRKALV